MIHQKKSRLTAYLTLILGTLVLFTSLFSLINKNIYEDIVATGLMKQAHFAGTYAQDMISVPAAAALILLSLIFLKRPGLVIFIFMLSIAANFLYGYGLYVISGSFTSLYLSYLAIFGLSIYSLIFGLTSFKPEIYHRLDLPPALRKAIGVFFIVIVCVFVPLWLTMMVPYIIKHIRPDLYAVFVMDLCFLMPAFVIIAVQLFKNRAFGCILAGIALIKTFILILTTAIGETIAPYFGMAADYPMIGIYSTITIISFVLGVFYIRSVKKAELLDFISYPRSNLLS